jgi:hypothetical protein
MLIDSWECYTQTWTRDMEKEFTKRRGYLLRHWLPALAGWVVDDHLTSERFLRDWRATISDLLVENYFGRLAELGHQQDLKLSFETAIGDVSPGDILQYFSKADIPMCEFWQPNDPHWGGFEAKPIHPTVSAAHIYGKPLIAAEAFTNVGIRWNEHPFMLKQKADQHFALGINHLVFHTYTHNPRQDLVPGTSFGSRIGTPFLRGQTWWKFMPQFTDYLSRCQFLLQQGQSVRDILWYLGDDLDHKPRQDNPFPSGYQFDYLNFDALTNRIRVENGQLYTPEGTSWQILWLPETTCKRLMPSTLKTIMELLKGGATVIGPPPQQNPTLVGRPEADAEFNLLVKELWGNNSAKRGNRKIGKGRLIWGDDLESTLLDLGITPDVTGTRSASWCHRRTDKTDIYFISADRQSALNANLSFRALGQPEFWNPMTGATNPLSVLYQEGNHTLIPVELPAAGSTFILFRDHDSVADYVKIDYDGNTLIDATDRTKVDQGDPYPNFGLGVDDILQPWIDPAPLNATFNHADQHLIAWRDGLYTITRKDQSNVSVTIRGTSSTPLTTDWTLAFPPGWDAPSVLELPNLKPWSALHDLGSRSFSGTAVYNKTFRLDSVKTSGRYILDLGQVAHIAEISVNGKMAATLWGPPFRVDITPYVEVGSNQLTVKVTNTWYNRLIYDAGLPEKERKTWTIHSPGTDAIMEASGLIGPVVLHTGKGVVVK